MAAFLSVLLDGIASGMLLFVLAVGLSVTLGLMNVVNLAHGAFGMVGGYVCVVLLNGAGVPFLAAVAAGRLKPRVDRVFPLSEARAAYAYMEEGRQHGKIVLVPDGAGSQWPDGD